MKRCAKYCLAARLLPPLVLSLLLMLVYGATVGAQDPTPEAEPIPTHIELGTLTVGVYHEPPFAMKTNEGTWDGLSVQLWREMADDLGVRFEWREVEPETVLEAVVDGEIDFSILAVATAEGERIVDFTQTYFISQLGTAERQEQTFLDVVRAIASRRFLITILWICVMIAVIGLAVWFFERHQNHDMYGQTIRSGAWSGFWWAAVTMSTIGYGDVVPKSTGGRIVALIWMFTAMVITASLTATITTVLTLTSGFTPLNFPNDLRNVSVATVEGSAAERFLNDHDIRNIAYENIDNATQALLNREADVVVNSLASLQYAKGKSGLLSNIVLRETDAAIQYFAMALPDGSPDRELFNQTLLARIGGSHWQEILERYAPRDQRQGLGR